MLSATSAPGAVVEPGWFAPRAVVCDVARPGDVERLGRVGALVVTEEGALVGIISERDFAREMITADKGPRDILVSDIMTTKVHTVHPTKTMADCMALMTKKRIRHLPVLDDEGLLIGLISIGDVVNAVITDQEHLIEDLERYITS